MTLLILAGGGIAVLAFRPSSGSHTLAQRVGQMIVASTPERSCIGGKASIRTLRASERPDLYPDLLPSTKSAQIVSCEDLGAVSVVVEFRSRVALKQAFARSRSARASSWCLVGTGAFDGPTLNHRTDLATYCRTLHGTVRRARSR